MYKQTPASINQFSSKYLKDAHKSKREILPRYISSIILNFKRKLSLTGMGNTILDNKNHKTTVSRFFLGKRFFSRDIYNGIILSLVMDLELRKTNKRIVLLIDGFCIKRGANTLIENANQYKKKKTSSKGRATKSHMFLMGLIILPNGLRIPAPRVTYFTKSYCKKHKKTYKTQHELAGVMIKSLRTMFPENKDIVVVADAFFDSKELFNICTNLKVTYIVPADKARIYIQHKKRKNLHERAVYKKKECKTYRIEKGNEQFSKEHARYHNPGANKTKKDVYNALSENLNISGLGDINTVFSWKESKQGFKTSSFKALLCNNSEFSVLEVLEFYALRWQIEIFFRELKSHLGVGDFTGRNFNAFERYIDLVLMAYVYLEWLRFSKLKKTKSQKAKGKLKKARTSTLILLVREEADKEFREWYIVKCA